MIIDDEFVDQWEEEYWTRLTPEEKGLERRLFEKVGPAVRSRGYYTKPEFTEVCRWKTERHRKSLTDDAALIRRITGDAFGASEERVSILDALPGVGTGRAFALLTVWKPDLYTIRDPRAIGTLRAAGYFPNDSFVPYGSYLRTCRGIAGDLRGRSNPHSPCLRRLDRALFRYAKTNRLWE